MDRIELRAPGLARPLTSLLARVVVGLDEALCQALLDAGDVTAMGRRLRSARRAVPPGTRIALAMGDLALRPEPDDAGDVFRALVPAPPWPAGELRPPRGTPFAYRVLQARGGVAEIELRAEAARAGALLEGLASVGWPAIGDGRRGGIAVEGGPRIRLADGDTQPAEEASTGWWPDEPVFPARPDDDRTRPIFRVSSATARALARGHPWVLPDEESDDPERFAPGTLVALHDPQSRALGDARIEGAGPIAARAWTAPEGPDALPSGTVAERVARALQRRRALMRKGSGRTRHRGAPHTDALRLVHGEADGLPGLAVDRLGPLLRILVYGRACASRVGEVADALVAGLADEVGADPPIIEVLHLRAPPPGRHESVWQRAGPPLDAAGDLIVHERGLRFRVQPGLDEPEQPRPGTGLYLDQRENRERLSRLAREGGRWLNLFAHTGAFSVALLAAGAEEVTSVDLSGAYLRWLESNLELNADRGVDAGRHRAVRRDGRRHLSTLPPGERFAGIVIDPPTAAAAGKRFWSAGRDLEALVAEALARLDPDGVLLVCSNERRPRRRLPDVVRRAAGSAGVRIGPLREAGPGGDFPRRSGFPEGDAFQGALVQRR